MGFQMSDADLDFTDDLVFQDKEVVKMLIKESTENAQSGNIMIKTEVLSGAHTGKEAKIFITRKDNGAAKKRLSQFFHCFLKTNVFTRDDCKNGSYNLAKLTGHIILARSSVRESKEQGKTFQNWDDLTDEGVRLDAVAGATGASPAANVGF